MKRICCVLLLWLTGSWAAHGQLAGTHFIQANKVARQQFGNDQDWYLHNVPFFACSDTLLTNVYYYRWKLFKAHQRNIGPLGYLTTEFLNAMEWDREPYSSLNDVTSFHLAEGRWLRDPTYMRSYIQYMYQHGGNDRHFSESIADAAYGYYLVHPDRAFIVAQLPAMRQLYDAWDDHYERSKGLYFIEPIFDATEYTISSIDASGGKDGFFGGVAFRPSINSYMYANALAIKNIALLNTDTATALIYQQRAQHLKQALQASLWNDSLQHFTDRYKTNNEYVAYWHYIRGRELVGYVPWAFSLPDDNARYATAWAHALNPAALRGHYGLRTTEPSYQYYMRQYRYDKRTGSKECQWNGPSWPFQTSQVLLGMANVLNDYTHQLLTPADYLATLRQYAWQHYLGSTLNLVEDYYPDQPGPIVNISQRSEHYNHSEFNNLIITGLCGLRPAAEDKLIIHPLLDTTAIARQAITYFCLENVGYRGRNITILYDRDGQYYHAGAGLRVFVDGRLAACSVRAAQLVVAVPAHPVSLPTAHPVNLAVNLRSKGFPRATASFTNPPDSLCQAIDGRTWYFPNVHNRWSCAGSGHVVDWYEVAFAQPTPVRAAAVSFYADYQRLAAPRRCRIEYWNGRAWRNVPGLHCSAPHPVANTTNRFTFKALTVQKLRFNFLNANAQKYTALAEVEIY